MSLDMLRLLFPLICNHPVNRLNVQREATRVESDKDSQLVTYHLACSLCGKSDIAIRYAALTTGFWKSLPTTLATVKPPRDRRTRLREDGE